MNEYKITILFSEMENATHIDIVVARNIIDALRKALEVAKELIEKKGFHANHEIIGISRLPKN